MRALALIKGPPPPLVARPRSSLDRSQGTFAPMLAHLGALGRHLGGNMSQRCRKTRIQMRSWSQHNQKQCTRRLNKPPEPPRIAKNLQKYNVFLLFFGTRLENQCLFNTFLDRVYKTIVFLLLLDRVYKTNTFLVLFWTESIKPMLFERFWGPRSNEALKES